MGDGGGCVSESVLVFLAPLPPFDCPASAIAFEVGTEGSVEEEQISDGLDVSRQRRSCVTVRLVSATDVVVLLLGLQRPSDVLDDLQSTLGIGGSLGQLGSAVGHDGIGKECRRIV